MLYVCRTEGEFSAGHPEGAVNIPYMNKTGSGNACLPKPKTIVLTAVASSELFCSTLVICEHLRLHSPPAACIIIKA
jgi:hypothetical protein